MSKWEFTRVPGLVRYTPTGGYYLRVKRNGRIVQKSLSTDVLTTAKQRLRDALRIDLGRPAPGGQAKLHTDWAAATEAYLQRLRASGKAPGTIQFRTWCLRSLESSWPSLRGPGPLRIRPDDVQEWWERAKVQFGPQYANNLLGTLRGVLNRPDYDDPTRSVRIVRVRPPRFKLPSQAEFRDLVGYLTTHYGAEYARLALVLAYTGLRRSEATGVTWEGVDLVAGRLYVPPGKNHKDRWVPIIAELRALLEAVPPEERAGPLLTVTHARSQMQTACRALRIPHTTHHDLRHLFATRCIEAGVDIPTISRWLGHQDGGALAMRTYGHLRDEHSAAMAAKVKFTA